MEKLAPPLRYEFWSTECLTLSFLCGTSSSEVGVVRGMGGVVDIVDSSRAVLDAGVGVLERDGLVCNASVWQRT